MDFIKNLQALCPDTTEDLLNMYLSISESCILNYLHVENYSTDYDNAKLYIALKLIRKQEDEALNSFSEGGMSLSYNELIDNTVKSMLPLPHVIV